MSDKAQGSDWPINMFDSQQFLVSDAEQLDRFGYSVSLSENVFIVGAIGVDSNRGRVYIFQRSPTMGWSPTESAQLMATDRYGTNFFWPLCLDI
jgi:hypothetical protein